MATIPLKSTHAGSETTEQRFRRLAAAWRGGTVHLSSSTARTKHPAYQEIVSMGPQVLPLLLRDLEQNETHWFAALREITGANPVPASAAGNVPLMIEAWLTWAKGQGHRW
jgi:hypothetical protein